MPWPGKTPDSSSRRRTRQARPRRNWTRRIRCRVRMRRIEGLGAWAGRDFDARQSEPEDRCREIDMKSFFRIAILALTLVLVALASALMAMRFAIHGQEVEVPAIVGISPADAGRLVSGLGL